MPRKDGDCSIRIPPDTFAQLEEIQREFQEAVGFTPSTADVIRFLLKHRPSLAVGSVAPDGDFLPVTN